MEKIDYSDPRNWWNKRIFLYSFIPCMFLLLVLWAYVWHVSESPDLVGKFETIEAEEGPWNCCKGDGKYERSFVGNKQISCHSPIFFPFGVAYSNCAQFNIPRGEYVYLKKTKYPKLFGSGYYISQIDSKERNYFNKTNKESRELLLNKAINDSWTLFVYLFLIIYFSLLIISTRKKGDK